MRYEVTAISTGSELVCLDVEGDDPAHVQREAQERGYQVIAVRPLAAWPGWTRRLRFPLLAFSQELCALLAAGLGLVESMQALAEKEERPAVRAVLQRVLQTLTTGAQLSQALRGHPAAFSPLFVATVGAAEKTGDLPEALARFVTYRVQIDLVRKRIVSALIYPLLLLGVGGIVTLFLLAYVVPRFASVFEESGRELPFLSQMLLLWGRFFESHWAAAVATLLTVAGGAAFALTRPAIATRIASTLWRIPSVGERLRVYQLARLYRTVGMLLESGLPFVVALKQSGELLSPQLRPRLDGAVHALGTGQLISRAMHENGLTTSVALRMLRVGERSGRLDELLGRIATFHEEEIARAAEWLTRLFEPVLMLLIGVVIGVIVLLMYMPVFELAGSLP